MNYNLKLLVFLVFSQVVHGQQFVGDLCIDKSSGVSGTCKLLADCPKAVEDLRKYARFPQTCGYIERNPIVCCSKLEETTETSSKLNRDPGEVSKEKCREYSSHVYEEKLSPTLVTGGIKVKRTRYIGFAHMAAIGYIPTPNDIQWLCGGSILSDKYILTAAHCLSHHEHGDAKLVMLGVTALNSTSKNKQIIKIDQIIAYPNYTSSHYHDIGLLKLEKPAKMNPFARPACLYLNNEITSKKAIATGWGHTAWAGEGSNDLLEVTLDLFDDNTCNSSYKNQIDRRLKNGIDNKIQICAGSPNEGKDACQGDSGGPLQINHTGDGIKYMNDIIGIVSFGKGCGNSVSVYTRVSYYIKWIEDIVWP